MRRERVEAELRTTLLRRRRRETSAELPQWHGALARPEGGDGDDTSTSRIRLPTAETQDLLAARRTLGEIAEHDATDTSENERKSATVTSAPSAPPLPTAVLPPGRGKQTSKSSRHC